MSLLSLASRLLTCRQSVVTAAVAAEHETPAAPTVALQVSPQLGSAGSTDGSGPCLGLARPGLAR